MQRKYNPKIASTAKMLRKNMTPEEKHLWYDFLSKNPIRFKGKRFLENTLLISIPPKQSLSLSLTVRDMIPKKEGYMTRKGLHFSKNTD